MARDRKRAKQRRERRVRESARAAQPSQPTRADVPGALDHASADVDEFDAALIRGADGAPADPTDAAPEELEDSTEDALQEAGGPARGGSGGGGDGQALAERGIRGNSSPDAQPP